VQLGLCCINTQLRDQKPPVFASRSATVRTVQEKGIEVLKERIQQNLRDVLTMMNWNEAHGIRVMRLSSDLFPHKSNPKIDEYDLEFAIPLLEAIGEKARAFGHRLTFHPGQYNVVGTPNPDALEQTVRDLSYHAEVLDLIDAGADSVMVVHGGGLYGDKEETKKRWCRQYLGLPDSVKRRWVLENCERCFSIQDCLDVSSEVGIPVVLDSHHFDCYAELHPSEGFKPPEDYIPAVLETWRRRGIKPKFHVSEQGAGRCGHHSDYIETIPQYLLEIPGKYGVDIDIMVEAKMKERAIERLYVKYPHLDCSLPKRRTGSRALRIID